MAERSSWIYFTEEVVSLLDLDGEDGGAQDTFFPGRDEELGHGDTDTEGGRYRGRRVRQCTEYQRLHYQIIMIQYLHAGNLREKVVQSLSHIVFDAGYVSYMYSTSANSTHW